MQIDDFFKINRLPLIEKTLVVAVSGGPDSMALLDMLYELKKHKDFNLIAAHLDHQLRPDSHCEDEVITAYCKNKDIIQLTTCWPKSLHPHSGIEAAARKYRYDFLLQVLQEHQGDYLLTAHHLDDLIENILLKFIRSGNPNEMNSLRAVSSIQGRPLLRPLLTMEKNDLLSYDQKRQIPFVIDKTNNNDETLRNRLRHHVVPMLKKENPQVGQNALRFSKQSSLLTSLAVKTFTRLKQPEKFLGIAYRLDCEALNSLTKAEQTVYWQYFIWTTWHRRVNKNLANFNLISYQGYFYLFKKVPLHSQTVQISLNHKFEFGKRHFWLSQEPLGQENLLSEFYAPKNAQLSRGSIMASTKFLLKNGQHVKSKKKFAENGIPAALRPYCLAIYANNKVVFVERTYTNQEIKTNECKYYLYESN